MPNSPVRLLIHGASGRMGRALLRLAAEHGDLRVVAGISRSGRTPPELSGLPMLPAAHMGEAPAFDLMLDFSLAEAFDSAVALCRSRSAGLVSGTTGLSATQKQALDTLAQQVPVLWSANFSAGVAVLSELVRQAAAALPEWDVDIVESHHVHKKDAPSGTALALGAAVERGGGRPPAYSSLRAGDIVGEHLVQFTGPGERLELTHRAGSRDIFARGALEAARRLAGRPPGSYRFAELLLGLAR
ncbi:4-hydroxy-tetrahydrodipicolinate reductase [Arenimonas fontis]|uniref:4-hydroxy-tetrahydrodipicolinate reductase n=1 Tax=Arenimonas fontis TaxID=2608255 RepID=A0A5B2ZDE4_9GAMM|nr:4-hydroxy-tetrahydrodipicolinate reductase [Arenimonas fontis]KAA2286047.1 4-hydroxy-tetrahydrodipicolinate reductase [Arenimonas fontis]